MKFHKIIKPIAQKHLKQIQGIARHQYHPLLRRIHERHHIAHRTLFYMKEYGSRSHIAKVIIRESLKVLLFASLLSSFGGVAFENIKILFVSLIPLVILLPTLNDMIGDYGIIISSRFTTMLHTGKIRNGQWKRNAELRKLFLQVLFTALLTGLVSTALAFGISSALHYKLTSALIIKILCLVLIDIPVLIILLFLVAVIGGIALFKRQRDPNNFLIPLTTSIADFGNMIVLAVLVRLFF